jgi:DNA-binding CsgD family transcriptional regulator
VVVPEIRDRRGRPVRGIEGLHEREAALRAIDEIVTGTQRGEGQALLIEGHAGMGKTRLHEAALDRGRAGGLRVLRAAGAELEAHLALGVAAQLLRRLLADLPPDSAEAVMADAPEQARVLGGVAPRETATEPDRRSIVDSIFAVIAAGSETVPTLVVVDDLHWCDDASLEFLLYLLHRLDEVPLGLVLGRRTNLGEGPSEIVDRIATHPSVALERLLPLGLTAVAEVTRRELPGRGDEALVTACHRATGGNPFYLHELLLELKAAPELEGDQLARRANSLAPDAVTRSLRVRVGRLGDNASALARAVAILGDEVPVRQAAALAGLPFPAAAEAADRLAAVEVLLAREPLQYVHPLVRHAIRADVPASERASRHLDAARLLYADGESAERVAAHLLHGRAEGSDWVVGRLQVAAREAQARGAAQSACRYLQRALAEPPNESRRPGVLAQLGAAEAALGSASAADHLAAAATAISDPLQRAQLMLEQGQALYGQGLHERAAAAYEAGLADLSRAPDEADVTELHDRLQTGYVATASLSSELRASAKQRSAELLARAEQGPRTQGQRMLLAQAALQSGFAGERAERTSSLAERAWDGGALLAHEPAGGMSWRLVTAALTLCGQLERAVELTELVLEDARQRESPVAFATAKYCGGLPKLWLGQVTGALAELEAALESANYGWRQFSRTAQAGLALCLIERGELEQAEEQIFAVGEIDGHRDLEDSFCVGARAELRLTQGRPAEALRDATALGAALGPEIRVLGAPPWQTIAALASLGLDERRHALELAREARRLADDADVLHDRIRAVRVCGLCEGGAEGLKLLAHAVELGSQAPPRLETVRALVDLGAALRRGNQRAASRKPLQQAADLARTGGATVLLKRALTELAAAGARPRRDWLMSGPASLTPSEGRIADLAASGQSNREIAQTLFVTPKTVEYHLRNAYRKLGITGRGALSAALSGGSPDE